MSLELVKTEDDRCPNCDYEDEYSVYQEIKGKQNTLTVLKCNICGYLFLDTD